MTMRSPGVYWSLGEGPFIFRELGSTGNYVNGAGVQVHTLGILGSTAKSKVKIIHGFWEVRALF